MKKVLILDDGSVGVENYAIRNVLENFGYLVTIYPIGRPQHYFTVFGEKEKLDYDYLIIGCHGDNGKIIVPVLGEDIYYFMEHKCQEEPSEIIVSFLGGTERSSERNEN